MSCPTCGSTENLEVEDLYARLAAATQRAERAERERDEARIAGATDVDAALGRACAAEKERDLLAVDLAALRAAVAVTPTDDEVTAVVQATLDDSRRSEETRGEYVEHWEVRLMWPLIAQAIASRASQRASEMDRSPCLARRILPDAGPCMCVQRKGHDGNHRTGDGVEWKP